MPAMWLGAAVGIATIAVLGCRWYTLSGILPSSSYRLSNSTRLHVGGTVASIWGTLISTPCMVPALSTVPIVCTGSVSVDEDYHFACIGLIEALAGQRSFARSIASYTLPLGDLLSPIQVVIDLNVAAPLLGAPPTEEFAKLRRRWIEGLLELVTQLQLSVARLTSTELAVHSGVNGMKFVFGFVLPKVALNTASDIALEGIVDSMSYVHPAITEAQKLTSELREMLQPERDAEITHHRDDDRTRKIFVSIQALVDVDEALQSLREDAVRGVLELVARGPGTLTAFTCPIHDVDGWLRLHINALRGLADSLDHLRVSISLLLLRMPL